MWAQSTLPAVLRHVIRRTQSSPHTRHWLKCQTGGQRQKTNKQTKQSKKKPKKNRKTNNISHQQLWGAVQVTPALFVGVSPVPYFLWVKFRPACYTAHKILIRPEPSQRKSCKRLFAHIPPSYQYQSFPPFWTMYHWSGPSHTFNYPHWLMSHRIMSHVLITKIF